MTPVQPGQAHESGFEPENSRRGGRFSRRAVVTRLCYIHGLMSTPSQSKPPRADAHSVTWKRDYKGCMVTIFGSQDSRWNVQIDKREPIILGYTRSRAIKYAKDLIDEEQAKYHSRSAGGAPRNGKASLMRPGNSFPTVVSADRRRG